MGIQKALVELTLNVDTIIINYMKNHVYEKLGREQENGFDLWTFSSAVDIAQQYVQ